MKDHKSYYFYSFRGQAEKILLNQLPKPLENQNYKIQGIISNFCGTCCLYFLYLIERIKNYDTILKVYF